MFTAFKDAARKPLVFVSDCDGTLMTVRGANPAPINRNLLNFLVEMKSEGHHVVLTSTAGANAASGIQIALMTLRQPKDIFDIDGVTVLDKAHVVDHLEEMGIEKVDFVFDDEKVKYLPGIEIGQHINPEIFTVPDFTAERFILPLPGGPA